MAPLEPKLIRARLMDPEKVVGLCLQIVKVLGLKPTAPPSVPPLEGINILQICFRVHSSKCYATPLT